MPFRARFTAPPRFGASGLALLAACLLPGCGSDPNEPPAPQKPVIPASEFSERIAPGTRVVRALDLADSVVAFTVLAADTTELVFFYQAELGAFSYTLRDSVEGTLLSQGFTDEDAAPGHLELRRTARVIALPGQVILFRGRKESLQRARIAVLAYVVDRGPEERGTNVIAAGDTIAGETLENSADIDEFTFWAEHGQELIAFVQETPGSPPLGVELRIQPASWYPVYDAQNPAGAELEGGSTGRFRVPTPGWYTAQVGLFDTLETTRPGTGYRLQVRLVETAPESVPGVLAPGDSLSGEAIDYVGDMDDFDVPVTAGTSYHLFLQTVAPSTVQLEAQVLGRFDDEILREVVSDGDDQRLAGQFTSAYTATTGTLRVRVRGVRDDGGLDRGAYRLFVYPVNRAPEAAPATIEPGTFVVEDIDFPGDIDEFSIAPATTGITNLLLRRTGSSFLDFTGPSFTRTCAEPEVTCGSGHVFGSAPYTVTVQSGRTETSPFHGTYRLTVDAIDFAPEGHSAELMLGEQIDAWIDPVGDEDWYTFSYTAGQFIEIVAHGGGGGGVVEGFGWTIADAAGTPLPGYAYGLNYTGHFTLPAGGAYRLAVGGLNDGRLVQELGTYGLLLRAAPTSVEGGTSAVAIGDSLATESIDDRSDMDEFLLTAAPGSVVEAYIRGAGTELTVDALAPGSHVPLVSGPGGATGPVTVPSGGQLRLLVYEPRTPGYFVVGNAFEFIGPYQLVVSAVE